MTATYSLSWDEFREVYQESLPRPSITSFVVTIFIAIAVGVFGGVLTYAVDPAEKMVASIFCWLSLVLFLLAFWDLKIRTSKRRDRVIQELRSLFERYHASEQTFAFDHEKWIHETNTGKHEAPWSGLLEAIERQNILTFSAKGHFVVVPKRIFDKDSLESLRQITLAPNGTARSLFRVSFLDYALTDIPSLWHRHPFLMAMAHGSGLLFFVMIIYTMYDKIGPGVVWARSVAGVFLFLTLTTQFWYFFIKYRTSHRQLQIPSETAFSENGVFTKTSKAALFTAWIAFRKVRETRRCFLLYLNATRYRLFPKRCLSAEQQNTLRKLLQAKLGQE